jgi:alkylation response protein AidB-like acyl-CoA dehydrogenase
MGNLSRTGREPVPDEFPVAAAAHICASRGYVFAAAETIQVHGGVGFTWEHPAHLYFPRGKSAELLFGGPPSTTSDSCDG